MSRSHDEVCWPPRYQHEVLLSTTGGKSRLRKATVCDSTSPSPIKRFSPNVYPNAAQESIMRDLEKNDDDEDDEETLQLQLQEIQARLRLKKIQKKNSQNSGSEQRSLVSELVAHRKKSVQISTDKSKFSGSRGPNTKSFNSQVPVDVPVSPTKKREQPFDSQKSPSRVLLGIDKGLKGTDVSLRRVPSLKNKEIITCNRFTGSPLQRSEDLKANHSSNLCKTRPQSFNERLAAVRQQDTESQHRESRLKRTRSAAFDIDRNQMQNFKESAVEFPDLPRQAPEFSRDEVLSAISNQNVISVQNKSSSQLSSALTTSQTRVQPPKISSDTSDHRTNILPPNLSASDKTIESEVSQFEPYSSQHLTKRIIPHQRLTRTLVGKKVYHIPDLFREIKAPDFSAPDIEEDLVIFGIIASKSEPKTHQQTSENQNRRKYMVMTLTDLKWELDLFLFDSAFGKFWKLTPGTIIAILNPLFMPPPRGKADTGKFSLTLNSDADTILEIGTARDLGFCKSVKRDGKSCNSWIDKRHTEFCDYHINATLKKTHASRMEVNTMTFGKNKFGGSGNRWKEDKKYAASFPSNGNHSKAPTTRYDRESHSHVFIGKRSTASLLDDVDVDPDQFHRGSTKEERITRRLLSQERERKLEQKLASLSSGLASEYARARLAGSLVRPTSTCNVNKAPVNALTLGLCERNIKDVALSPLKRKRIDTSSSISSRRCGNYPLLDLNGMDRGRLSLAPAKKKTRFITEKGIKEAGRESLSMETINAITYDDSNDDLDIIQV